jgi:tetratricopeptide (TPR) repeat protein
MVHARSLHEERETLHRVRRARPSPPKVVQAPPREVAPAPPPTSLRALRGYTAEELEAVADLGYLLYSNGRLDDARVVFDGLVAIDPANAYHARALAAALFALGDLEGALGAVSKSITLSPTSTAALLLRAQIHLAASRPAEASADLERVLSSPSAAAHASLARLLYERAREARNGTASRRHQR